jgi:hypothetical protein
LEYKGVGVQPEPHSESNPSSNAAIRRLANTISSIHLSA